MSDNVENATIEILRNIQASISEFRAESNERFGEIESLIRKERRNSAGMLVMMRATAGDFDSRVREIEARVAALEAQS